MKALKIIGIVIGSIVLLVVIIFGVIWFMISRPSKIANEVTTVANNEQAAQALDTKWDDFKAEVAQAPVGKVVTITMTEEQVNSKINEGLKTTDLPSGMTIGKMNVNLLDGKILLSATIQYSVLTGNAGMSATVDLVDGQPTITVTEIDMGSLPIPQSIKDQLRNLIPKDALFQTDASFQAQSIVIADHVLTITGIKK
jgi:hypothetical protein